MALDSQAAVDATRAIPSIPRDAEGPVFREPWEAQAFAMALALHARGLFSWTEWAATLESRQPDPASRPQPVFADRFLRIFGARRQVAATAPEPRRQQQPVQADQADAGEARQAKNVGE